MNLLICCRCGRTPDDRPGQKYCGDGGDKDFGHRYDKVDLDTFHLLRSSFLALMYPKDLDEYAAKDLRAELQRRRDLRDRARCDYCGQPGGTPACKFPERHKQADLEMQSRNHHIETGVRIGFSNMLYGPRPTNSEQIRALYRW